MTIKVTQVNKYWSEFSIFYLCLLLQLLLPGYDAAQEKTELDGGLFCLSGGVLFVDCKVFIALGWPVMSILCLTGKTEQCI